MSMLTIPDDMKEVFVDLLRPLYVFQYKGKPVNFALAKGQCTYRYFEDARGVWHCYTPHPSTDGDYFVWDYVPHGKGARTRKAKRYTMKNVVRCAHRNTAKSKAIARSKKA